MKMTSNKVLVRLDPPRLKVSGGIVILADNATERPLVGTVISVGPGKTDKKGRIVPMEVKVGDRVALPSHRGTGVRIGAEENKKFWGGHTVIEEEYILGIVEDESRAGSAHS